MAVPYTFATATTSIPLSQLDSNFATAITLGNTSTYLGNTTTSIGNLTLTNATISSGNITISSISDSGNLTFTGTGNRITGDFSNATQVNRVAFQTSTANSASAITVIPNGTSIQSSINIFNNSDPTNASLLNILTNSTIANLNSTITGTGTYLPMIFSTGGSERARIDTSGNVGIGTTSPSSYGSPLSVYAATNPTFSIASGNANAYLRLYSTSDNNMYLTNTGGAMTVITANAERMRIDSSGNVGIGATATNRLSLTYDGSSGAATIGPNSASGSTFLTLGTSNAGTYAERMRIDSSGNVGIGTSSPSSKLQIAGGSIQLDTSTSVAFGNINTRLQGASDGSFIWYGSGSERMRIDSSGNVGIGTTANASAILDAQSTTKGVRFPNMTTTQKNAVSSPAAGLVVFDTTLSKLCVYSGAAWQTITSV